MKPLRQDILIGVFSLLLVSPLFLSVSAYASENDLIKATEAYQDGNFSEALRIFEDLNKDVQSAGLYFNSGNCYMRLGQIGYAITAYYAAQRRDPNHPGIRHNLQYALRETEAIGKSEDKLDTIHDVFLNIIRYVSLRSHQIIFLLSLFLLTFAVGYYGVYLRFLQSGFWPLLLLTGWLLLDAGILFSRYQDTELIEGVILEQEASVYYGPSNLDTVAFQLPLGSRFVIHREEKDWVQIQIDDGKVGWLSHDVFAVIS